jgi:hypothetical protein
MKETPTITIGQLVTPHEIRAEQGDTVKINEWAGRASWSYLRLIYGRKIDDTIKDAGTQREDCIYELMRTAKEPRQVQFIMSSSRDVLAVASLKHLLIEPRKVYETARDILGDMAVSNPSPYALALLTPSHNLHGETFMTSQGFAGIKVGYQVDGGDLLTRFAIRVGVFARVEMCFNPLSWLGVSSLGRFGLPADYERVLRIQKLNELFPRLNAAIVNARTHISDLQQRVERTKTVNLSSTKAATINGAFCLAYGLGEKVIGQVMDRYKEESKTQYGLAMAQSWVSEHGIHRKAQPTAAKRQEDHVPQSLSTISGATLLIDVKTAADKIKTWLGQQKSKLAEDILKGRLP